MGGEVRKYDALTDAGRAALVEARPKIAELVGEAVEGRGPARLSDPADTAPEDWAARRRQEPVS